MRLCAGLYAALLLLPPRWALADETSTDAPEADARPSAPSPRTALEVGLLLGHQESLDSGSDPFGATFGARVTLRPRDTPLFFRASYLFGLGSPPPSADRSSRHAHSLLPEVGLAVGRRVEGRFTLGLGLVVEQRSRFEGYMTPTTSAGLGVHLGSWFLSAEVNAALGLGDDPFFTLGALGGLAYRFE